MTTRKHASRDAGMCRTCLSALAAVAMVGGCGRVAAPGDVTDGSSLDQAAPDDSDTTTDAAVESCSGDAAPGLVTLVSGQNANNLVVKATGVYWTAWGADAGSTVMSLPLGGGVPTTIVAVEGEVSGLAVDATHAYWTEVVSDAGAPLPNSVVMSVPLVGGTPTTIASGQVGAGELAVDSTSVYWTTSDATTASVMKVALDGGTPTTLASGQLASAQGGIDFIAVDDSNVYWVVNDYPFFGVVTVPLQGGVSTTLAAETSAIYGLAVDTTSVYWTAYGHGYANPPTGAINKMTLAKGDIVPVATGSDLIGLAVDGTNAYWTSALGSIYRVPVSGGTPVTVSSQFGGSLAVDCTSLYWTGAGDIVRLSPK